MSILAMIVVVILIAVFVKQFAPEGFRGKFYQLGSYDPAMYPSEITRNV